ncbi:MAG: DPP IV N-terminal domain-containing protein, partial [Gemmatimonadota bacterium]|nr:DPP IV N-terminal domain-containing protein [Gemmatimonadota bacterium]
MLKRTLILLAGFVVSVPTPAVVAQVGDLTVEAIWGSPQFNSSLKSIQWLDDVTYTTTERHGEHIDLYRVEVETEDRELILRGEDLVPPGESEPIRIEGYEFSNDRSKLLIYTNSIRVWRQNTKGEYYVWDFDQGRLLSTTQQEGYQSFAKFSPDNRLVGFVRDNNIFVTNLATGEETQITSDGSDDIINGTSDWVYEEELGLRDAFRFSPDGSRIAFWRLDQTTIRPFALIDELDLYPEINDVRYPKAGEQNSTVQIGMTVIGSGDVVWADLGEESDIYVARMNFMPSGDAIWLTRLNRHQNQLDLMVVDAESGSSRIMMTDRDDAWVDANTPIWLEDGRFLFLSERNGFSQIHLFGADGRSIRNLTPDSWDVQTVHGVDAPGEWVYFSGFGEGPLERHVYRVPIDGGDVVRLTSEAGSHAANFSAGLMRFVDTYSRAHEPPTQ